MHNLKIGWRLQVMLWIIKTFQKPIHQSDIHQLKKRSNSKFTAYFYDLVRISIARVWDFSISSDGNEIAIRLYHPRPGHELPVILYFHGGGFVLGGIEAYDHFCRRLCDLAKCAVVSVEYRLAPEFKFPAAHNDALVALNWVLSNGSDWRLDTNSLFLAGDSSGGNLAASLAFQAREMKIAVKGQVLIYPVLDFYSRKRRHYDQFLLGEEGAKWFAHNFLDPDQDRQDPRLTLRYNQDFSDLPPTLIIQAEYDHLNDEIEDFHNRLVKGGTRPKVEWVQGAFHGYITMMNWTREAKQSLAVIGEFVEERKGG